MSAPKEGDDQIIQLWALGVSTAEIGRRMGRTKNQIVGRAHRIGCPFRPKAGIGSTLALEKSVKAKNMLLNGMSNYSVAKFANIDQRTAARLRIHMGVGSYERARTPAREQDAPAPALVLVERAPPRPRVVVPVSKFSSIKVCAWVGGATGPDRKCEDPTVYGTSWCNDHGRRCFVSWPPRQAAA